MTFVGNPGLFIVSLLNAGRAFLSEGSIVETAEREPIRLGRGPDTSEGFPLRAMGS